MVGAAATGFGYFFREWRQVRCCAIESIKKVAAQIKNGFC
jgi:hypothetical protein